MVLYFQFREEELRARQVVEKNAEMQILGEIMYQFLTHLEVSEFEWLADRNQKLKQGLPVGVTMESAGKKE